MGYDTNLPTMTTEVLSAIVLKLVRCAPLPAKVTFYLFLLVICYQFA